MHAGVTGRSPSASTVQSRLWAQGPLETAGCAPGPQTSDAAGRPDSAAACAERQTCGHRGREDGSRRGWPTRTAGPFHRTLGAVIPPVCSRVRGTGVTRHLRKQKTRPGAGRPRGGTGATSQALPAARLAVPFRAGVWAAGGPVRPVGRLSLFQPRAQRDSAVFVRSREPQARQALWPRNSPGSGRHPACRLPPGSCCFPLSSCLSPGIPRLPPGSGRHPLPPAPWTSGAAGGLPWRQPVPLQCGGKPNCEPGWKASVGLGGGMETQLGRDWNRAC